MACQYVIEQGKCEALDEYRNDLTELARRGKLNPVLRREDEIERCIRILSRDQTKNNPIIIGERGRRRTEIVEGLAQGMVHGTLVHRKLISLDTGSLLAGAESGRHLAQRLEAVLKDITASNNHDRKIIIFIDEIHTLIGADVDVGNLLYSMLGRGRDVRIVGATTWSGYKEYIDRDLDLEYRFQKVLCEHGEMGWLASISMNLLQFFADLLSRIEDAESLMFVLLASFSLYN
ncbi:hypothetical protein RHSIM_Rhsim07G0123500 [Rhododendron simsii]|uniref:ATPase AAA-type core domain-containing protein n=1 Tax=Rhododendron simsii TaxID=118357 RepID=A0A834LIW1_RHOSS|nr:hypothetical protein RHSIM_Rhsim07G0123500 [Rhododendron simsii]